MSPHQNQNISGLNLQILPGGTDPAAVRQLHRAVHQVLFSEDARTNNAAAQVPVLVPIAPEVNPATAQAQLGARIRQPLPPQVAVIAQTSGSTTQTGRLVGLSAAALLASAQATQQKLGGPGRWVLALPAHHIAGLQILVRSLLAKTEPLVIDTSAGFSPEVLAETVAEATAERTVPGYLSLVPTQVAKIIQAGPKAIVPLRKLQAILVGGQALSPQLAQTAREEGLPLVQTYGMTETGGGCVYDGVPLGDTEISCEDERIWIKGSVLMEGYLDRPDTGISNTGTSTDFEIRDGQRWLRTDDRGYLTQGRLTVMGRVDQIINTGGVKVAPEPVEDLLAENPAVARVCVVGVPDKLWGNLVTAVVVRAETSGASEPAPQEPAPQELSPQELAPLLRAQVQDALGKNHAPRAFVFVEELPLAESAKVARSKVSALAQRAVASGEAWIH